MFISGNRLLERLKLYLKRLCNVFKKDASSPVFTRLGVPGLKVHLGAGPINLQGWINIDARGADHIHLQTDSFDLNEFSDGSLAEIYICHVLEHFSFDEAEALLRNFKRKLKPNGVLRISVPDFDCLVTAYHANKNNLQLIKRALMGGQDYVYNFHKSVYNHSLLHKLMVECGFENPQAWITEEDFGCDLGDWSNQSFATPAGKFPVSLNMKATVGI